MLTSPTLAEWGWICALVLLLERAHEDWLYALVYAFSMGAAILLYRPIVLLLIAIGLLRRF